jgi:translation initiation factor 3 subunit E
MEQLNGRAWLLHWSLFLFFKHEDKVKSFLELSLESNYDLTMELMCRHLLRYLFGSLLISKKKDALSTLKGFVKETSYKFSDEYTEFVRVLTMTFAFDSIPTILAKLQKVHYSLIFSRAALPTSL